MSWPEYRWSEGGDVLVCQYAPSFTVWSPAWQTVYRLARYQALQLDIAVTHYTLKRQ